MLSRETIVCRLYSGFLISIWFLAPYFILQQVEVFPTLWVPQTEIDQLVPVCLPAVWLYASSVLILCLVGLTVEKKYLIRYLYAMGWATTVCHAVFLFIPNGVSRAEIPEGSGDWIYKGLIALDRPRNALPSLLATLLVTASITVLRATRFKLWLKLSLWLWIAAVFWSMIAIRQHTIVDILAAFPIAIAAWYFVGRSPEMKYHGVE